MGYFEGITASYFKTDKDGNTIFYPYGIFGKGYILPDEKKEQVRLVIKRYMQVSLPIVIVMVPLLKAWFVIFFVCPLYFLGYAIWMSKLTKTFKKSKDKLTFTESRINSAHAHNLSTLWLFEIICLLFIVAGIYIIGQSPKGLYIGILSIAFFGFCGCVIFKMIEIKKEDQQKNRNDRE